MEAFQAFVNCQKIEVEDNRDSVKIRIPVRILEGDKGGNKMEIINGELLSEIEKKYYEYFRSLVKQSEETVAVEKK